jgi:ferric-dicitrate binding protein FerR (iron transport regulator)
MKENKAKYLLAKYAAGECTPEEKAIIESWYLQQQHQSVADMPDTERLDDMQDIRNKLLHEINPASLPVRRLWPRIAAAASILLILSFGGYFLLRKQSIEQIAQNSKQDIAPAISHATLTLANGQKIALIKSLTGKLAQQGNTSIAITADKDLSYLNKSQTNNVKVQYNTLTTIRGEQAPFALQLADGTKVWLNAASSITFPVAFNGDERKVTVTGEAYFEVVHNSSKPFRVIYKNQTIEDIGTHFNINTYEDEPSVKTTLLEGSISVSKDKSKAILKPGQQAITLMNSMGVKVKDVNTEETVAWKNGYFSFNDEKITAIMRKLSRWYNIDIQYNDNITDEGFYGKISRSKNISEVLEMLTKTKRVYFKIEGRRITVMQ